jgi:hypothetical protein
MRLWLFTDIMFFFTHCVCDGVNVLNLRWLELQVSGLILENTFTSVLDMAGVMLPPLRFFVGGPGSGKGPKLLNWLVKSPWRTIDLVTDVCTFFPLVFSDLLFTVWMLLSCEHLLMKFLILCACHLADSISLNI